MRMYALIVFCAIVALLSGVSLFWSVTNQQGEAWMHVVFLVALITALFATLSLIRRAAGRSISSNMKIEQPSDTAARDERKAG